MSCSALSTPIARCWTKSEASSRLKRVKFIRKGEMVSKSARDV